MSEEQSSVESSEQGTSETTETVDQTVETQQTPTETVADTSEEIKSNGSELGLSKQEPSSEVDTISEFSSNLDSLVKLALNGELTDEQRQSLEEGGLGQHFDMIVSGHKAQIEANDNAIFETVGGKESYGELQEWGVANLSDAEIESFNHAVLESGDIELAKLAVEGLQARYAKANGQAPSKVIESGGTSNQETRPYSDVAEYLQETQSFKYNSDPEYAAQVERKRELSGF